MKSQKKVKPAKEVRDVILLVGLRNCLKRLLPTKIYDFLNDINSLHYQVTQDNVH